MNSLLRSYLVTPEEPNLLIATCRRRGFILSSLCLSALKRTITHLETTSDIRIYFPFSLSQNGGASREKLNKKTFLARLSFTKNVHTTLPPSPCQAPPTNYRVCILCTCCRRATVFGKYITSFCLLLFHFPLPVINDFRKQA